MPATARHWQELAFCYMTPSYKMLPQDCERVPPLLRPCNGQ